MSELALELLNQLSNKLKSESIPISEQKTKEQIREEIIKSLPEPSYTKAQKKQIKKHEDEVAELILRAKKIGGTEKMIKNYQKIISMPLVARYVIIGSSVKPHHGYTDFVGKLKKLMLFDKVKDNDRLQRNIKF